MRSLILATLALASCRALGPTIDGYAVNTAEHYTENKVLFLGPGDGTRPARRKLYHAFELPEHARPTPAAAKQKTAVPAGAARAPQVVAPRDLTVKRLDPLGVIVRGVRLPAELEGRRDVAVILNVVTAGAEASTPIVVFYQRDVPGGQMLNFADLLVYYDPSWDGRTPPYFRLRVLEVNSERNQRTRAMLEEAGNLPEALAGSIPHPVLPVFNTAVEAAKLVLGSRRNEVLLDYQVQFYSKSQIKGAGDSILSPLRRGEWLVVGRARGETSEFWSSPLEVDLRTGMLHRAIPASTSVLASCHVQVPYVAVTIMAADAVVPKHIMDRSKALIDLLASPTERVNFDALTGAVGQLDSAVKAYKLERRMRKHGSKADFNAIVALLTEQADDPSLSTEQERRLVRLVDLMTPGDSLGSVHDVVTWFEKDDVAEGGLVEDEDAPLGFVWRKAGATAGGGGK